MKKLTNLTQNKIMNNKTKIILGSSIIAVLILSVIFFTQKRNVDEKLSNEVAEKLKEITKDLDFIFNFEKVNVNSAGPYVELSGVEIINDDVGTEISFDKLKVGTSYDEILKIISDQEITKIESMYLEMENVVVDNFDMDFKHTLLSEARFEYSGSIDQKSFENMKRKMLIPESDQNISVSISDFSVPIALQEEIYGEMGLDIRNVYNNASLNENPIDINFEMDLLSDKKIIKIVSESKNNGEYSGSSEFDMQMSFDGNKFDEIAPKSMEIDGKFDVNMNGFISEIEQGIELEMNEISASISGSFDIDENMSEEEILRKMDGSVKFNFEEFAVKFPNEITAGMPPGLLKNNMIDINEMSFSMNLADGDASGDFDYNSSIGKIKSNFNFGINMKNPDNSYINNFEVLISDLPKELDELIKVYEMGVGNLPRKGNSIYLNIYGSFDNPKVEGLNL